jgi:hypothetical protein
MLSSTSFVVPCPTSLSFRLTVKSASHVDIPAATPAACDTPCIDANLAVDNAINHGFTSTINLPRSADANRALNKASRSIIYWTRRMDMNWLVSPLGQTAPDDSGYLTLYQADERPVFDYQPDFDHQTNDMPEEGFLSAYSPFNTVLDGETLTKTARHSRERTTAYQAWDSIWSHFRPYRFQP